ncbi:MAG: fibronectin type III domain-containing protein [Candidatus Latescibacterota bacterium]
MKKLMLFLMACIPAGMMLAGCDSSTGSAKVDLVSPPFPSDLAINQIGNGSVSLTWEPVTEPDLKGYNVYWQGGATIDTLKANRLFTTANALRITDLDYETTYSFAVTSIDMSGNESRLSVYRSGKPYNTTPPLPPSGVDMVAENIEFPKITLYWSDNSEPDIAQYRVYRALTTTGFDENQTPLATVTQQSHFTDTSIEVGVAYYYRIRAVDKGGWESAPSLIAGDAVLPRVTLLSPINFEYAGLAPTLTWQGVNGAKKYNVVLTTSRIGGEIWNIEVDSTVNQITYNGRTALKNGNTYYWKIGAISRKEINSVSNVGSFVVRTQKAIP